MAFLEGVAVCGLHFAFEASKHRRHLFHLANRRELVEANPHAGVGGVEEVKTSGYGRFFYVGGGNLRHLHRIEEGGGGERCALFAEGCGKGCGAAVGVLRYGAKPVGAVVHGVHSRHGGQQGLRRADVAGGFFALDVLLARLERHSQRFFARSVNRNADDAPGQEAPVLVLGGHVPGVRPAEAHGDSEALGAAHGNVGAPRGRLLQKRKAQDVAGGGEEDLPAVELPGKIGVAGHVAVGRRVLHDGAKALFARLICSEAPHNDAHANRGSARAHDVERLRENIFVHKYLVFLLLHGFARPQLQHHVHGFGGGGGFVEQRAAAHRQTGEAAYRRLEVEQGLQAPLRNFGLIGRVGGVPRGVFQNVALDDGGQVRTVVPHANQRAQRLVFGGKRFNVLQVFVLACGGAQPERLRQANVCRNNLIYQLLKALYANGGKHVGNFCGVGPDMATVKWNHL